MADQMNIFDRSAVRRHRDRAAPTFAEHHFLFEEVAERLAERVEDVARDFPLVLDIGAHDGSMARALAGRKGIDTVVSADMSLGLVKNAPGSQVVSDEEFLPFAPGVFDLVVSNLSLHWVNDLPGALIQARQALKPDGFFCAAMLGGETLRELRDCLMEAEIELEGGLSPRISPFADVRDTGMLMQRAGFAMPMCDSDILTVSYQDPIRLMQDLRGMGETNAVIERRKGLSRRETLMDAAQCYVARHADEEGRIPATFQVVYLSGWAPSAGQPKAKRPGSATHRLADALGSREISLDEPTGRG